MDIDYYKIQDFRRYAIPLKLDGFFRYDNHEMDTTWLHEESKQRNIVIGWNPIKNVQYREECVALLAETPEKGVFWFHSSIVSFNNYFLNEHFFRYYYPTHTIHKRIKIPGYPLTESPKTRFITKCHLFKIPKEEKMQDKWKDVNCNECLMRKKSVFRNKEKGKFHVNR